MENFVTSLHHKLSRNSFILTALDPGFEAAYERWTDIDRKTPAVIVPPANEQDVAVLVREYPPFQSVAVAGQTLTHSLLLSRVGQRSSGCRSSLCARHRGP